jgi:alpha-mannosidase
MPEKRTGHVVSHTHWDRAWYWTFEQTRVRLLDLMDDLLDLMERDPAYRHFTLDGQLAMVEDYLALRPERRRDIRRLAVEGRLLLGPFLVLPDLFIPCGESLVRNLRAGHAAAADLGPVMKVGYLPDPFGHPAQLPQVLRGFGIQSMVFSRGMGDEWDRLHADFLWEAPDGSRVLATHQVGGYGNLERLGQPPHASAREPDDEISFDEARRWALRAIEERVAEMRRHCPSGHLLLNNGCDHLPAQPGLPALIKAVNRGQGAVALRHSTIPAYHRAVGRAIRAGRFRPRVHRGELRGGRFANLLPGVLSARVDIKLRHQLCEELLLRWTEPWSALARAAGLGRDDRALLDHAWRLLLLCQPHDDICGCSIDRVHEDDLARMARTAEVAECVRDRALEAFAVGGGWMAFNPHPWPLDAVVDLEGRAVPVALPPLGYAPLTRRQSRQTSSTSDDTTVRRASGRTVLQNGILRVEVRERSGQLRITDLRSGLTLTRVAELVDEGDAGDTYDYSPPRRQRVVRGPARFMGIRVRETGLRARVGLSAELALPRGLTRDRGARRRQTRRVPITMELVLQAGSPRLEITLTVANTVEDHRLRFTLTAPIVTDVLHAGAPFQVVTRPLRPAGGPGWHQLALPYQPFMDFVALGDHSGGVALLAPGLREVEATRLTRGTRLGVTLLRSVGWLSRDDLRTRVGEAGPCFEVQGARHLGETLTFRLGIVPYQRSWLDAGIPRHYAELAAPPRVLPCSGTGDPPAARSFLELSPGSVQLVALAPRPEGALEARLVNLSSRPVRARLRGPSRARRLQLDGTPLRGKVDLDGLRLRGGEIVTLELAYGD